MTSNISPNTQAILLLTAPLIAGRGSASVDLLTPSEYNRFAGHLQKIKREPADLVSAESAEILRDCRPVIDEARLQRLLGRGFLLTQVVERWQSRAIWVVSRADFTNYPSRFKAKMRENAPAIIYGCGDINLLNSGGLAVVGSRNIDDSLIDYTLAIGQLAARAGTTIVSGGAKGVDQAAMRGALEGGGRVCGVMADSLERAAMNREHRNNLLDGKLTLISPYDPNAGFNAGNAMQRNKLIYALADASLVVNSDINKGGTWTGAVEQLDKLKFVPVFVRSTGEPSAGLEALRKKGALPWPNPKDVDSFEEVFNVNVPSAAGSPQPGLSLTDRSAEVDTVTTHAVDHAATSLARIENKSAEPVGVAPDNQDPVVASERMSKGIAEEPSSLSEPEKLSQVELPPAEVLFSAARKAIERLLLIVPMKEAEVADALNITNAQAKEWLKRLAGERVIEKDKKSAKYVINPQPGFFGK